MLRSFVEAERRPPRAIGAIVVCTILAFHAILPGARAALRVSGQEELRQLGLKRAWFAQVRLDPSRNHVERATLVGDRLSVLTSAGVLQEFNALTGETMWIAPIGNPDYPSLGPAGDERYVAVLNGSTLYVLDRSDGRPVKIRSVGGAPGASAAISSNTVFVPLITGRIEGYPLEGKVLTPWYYQSFGRAMVAPLTTPDSFVWATDSGRLYVGRLDGLRMRFRLETSSEIAAPPAYGRPFVYAATVSGEVFAMHELTGVRHWKYATGFPVMRAPAAVEDRVFVTSDEPALHCIEATKGGALWEAPKVTQFAALSRDRVYGVDELGRLVAMNAETGALVGRMAADLATHALVNDQTDRIYLVSQAGLVQCLHELDAAEPLYHKPAATEEEQPAAATGTETAQPTQPEAATPTEPEAEEEASPFKEETEEAEMPEVESPFGVDEDNPFDF